VHRLVTPILKVHPIQLVLPSLLAQNFSYRFLADLHNIFSHFSGDCLAFLRWRFFNNPGLVCDRASSRTGMRPRQFRFG